MAKTKVKTLQRPVLQFRTHPDVYAALKSSAAARKLTISEEAARLIEQALGQVGLLAALLEDAYGPALAPAFVKAHEHGLLKMRRADKEALRDRANKVIDTIPESEK
jgi:hypothetical protein